MDNIYHHASAQLQQNTRALVDRLFQGKVRDFLKEHARLLDAYFIEAFETSMVGPRMNISKNPYAIIALGGYGREEQCIHSDVDLLFLFKKRVPDQAENLIREIVYPLWDIGLEVGYATRSLKECISLSAKDFDILTPMLDARFICGWSHIYSDLMDQLREKVIRKKSRTIINWLIENNKMRHVHFGDSAYLLEPNLKEGQGGLRDYHTMQWIGQIEFNIKQPRDLEYFGLLSHEEYRTLRRSLVFIWKVRNRLHDLCGRKYDQLHFENQIKLAENLKYKQTNGQQPVERFLGELHGRMEALKQQHLMFLYELGLEKKRKRRRISQKQGNVEGIEVIEWGMLNFVSPEKIRDSPLLLIKIFEESARLKIPLSAEAKRLIKEFAYLVTAKFRNSEPVVQSFERILVTPALTFNVLNEMLNTGFLVRLIPEFRNIVNRIQYDEYHLYPVDKHLLRTVHTVKNFGTKKDNSLEPLCAQVYRDLKNRKLLLWAALLHDIGKGDDSDDHAVKGAAAIKKLLAQKGLSPADVDSVEFLVENHLFLIKRATRRDIHDEETAIFTARRIRNIERLKMLYLLTVADSISTGPMAWNDWTAALLRNFFLKILNVLEKGELATKEAVKIIEQKRKDITGSARTRIARQEIGALFDNMSPRYRLYMPAGSMLEHIKLFDQLGDADFIWDIEHSADANTRTVTICAKDRPGLISKIAGVFTLNNIDILDVQVFTWRNNIALDIFKVKPPPDPIMEEEKWRKTARNLKDALSGDFKMTPALSKKTAAGRRTNHRMRTIPHRITVDNTSSSFFTIIEVVTYDFPGLLFNITDALFNCDLNIWVAKIATKADQVVDVFYVWDLSGQKVDSEEQVEEIKLAVLDRLPEMKTMKIE
ncbi:MAG: [protein-PII] uridylyltransferase [bacterium]|nr:[protein-PII] uridylyltransferase [bacterium]